MPEELSVRISGQAGQGIETVGEALSKLFKACGYHLFSNQDYMSRVRGGNNFFQIRISSVPVQTLRGGADIIIELDKATLDAQKNNPLYLDIPLHSLAVEAGGSELFVNSVAMGAVAGLLGIGFEKVRAVISGIFSKKGPDITEKNNKAALSGYEFAAKKYPSDKFAVKPGQESGNFLMNGNDAVSLGAIRAGCKFYSAYPMTPSTGILNTIAKYASKYNIIVEQAEDEIAAINMAVGASYAGARSMVGTSGGGFALMVEGVSLAGMTETPVVIVMGQRPGPATGFPTRTEQGDLEFIIHSGHGEFARAVFSPGNAEEAFYLTVKAFNIAEKYQIPVFVLTDQHLADCVQDIAGFEAEKAKVFVSRISKKDSQNITGYKRYVLTESGISPLAVPSWIEDPVYLDSDEHTEEGHITEDAALRGKMVEKRFYKKMKGLTEEVIKPTSGNLENADIVLVGFGSNLGVLTEASRAVTGKKVGFIHISQIWPFPSAHLNGLLSGAKKIMTLENNAGAQLARLMKGEASISVNGSILKFDGRPFDLDHVIGELGKI